MTKKIAIAAALLFLTIGIAKAYAVIDTYQGGTGITSTLQGDLLVGTTSLQSYGILHVGGNGNCLTASSGAVTGLAWASCGSGGGGAATATIISAGFTFTAPFTFATTTGISISSSSGNITFGNTGVTSWNGGSGALTGVSSIASGTNISASAATGTVTINFVNPGFVTSASSVIWSAAQTWTATSTFQSSTLFTFATSSLLVTNASGSVGTYAATSCAAGTAFTGLSPTGTPTCTSYAPSTTIPTNDNQLINGANFITFASSGIFSAAITHTATDTFQSSTILTFATNTLISADSNGKLQTTTLSTGLTFSGNTLTNTGVTLIATSSPITAANGTGTVTIGCATCLTSDVDTVYVSTSSVGAYAEGNIAFVENSSTISASSGLSFASSTGVLTYTNVKSALELANSNGALTAFTSQSNPCGANSAVTTISAVGVLGGCVGPFGTGNGTVTTSTANAATQLAIGDGGTAIRFSSSFTATTSTGVLSAPTGTFIGTLSVSTTTISAANLYVNGNTAIGSSTNNGLLSVVNASNTIAFIVSTSTANANKFQILGSSSQVYFGVTSSGIPLFLGTSTAVAIGGSSLALDACTSTTTVVPFALNTSTDIAAKTSPIVPLNDSIFDWTSWISQTGANTSTVTTQVCTALAAGATPTSTKYLFDIERISGM